MKNYVLTPGPVPVPEFVMLEMAKPIIHHRTEEFEEIFHNATEGLKKVFMTKEEVLGMKGGRVQGESPLRKKTSFFSKMAGRKGINFGSSTR